MRGHKSQAPLLQRAVIVASIAGYSAAPCALADQPGATIWVCARGMGPKSGARCRDSGERHAHCLCDGGEQNKPRPQQQPARFESHYYYAMTANCQHWGLPVMTTHFGIPNGQRGTVSNIATGSTCSVQEPAPPVPLGNPGCRIGPAVWKMTYSMQPVLVTGNHASHISVTNTLQCKFDQPAQIHGAAAISEIILRSGHWEACVPPPLKWSSLKYGFGEGGVGDGKEEAYG